MTPFNLWSHRFAVVAQGGLLVFIAHLNARGVAGLGFAGCWSFAWMMWSFGKLQLHRKAVKAEGVKDTGQVSL